MTVSRTLSGAYLRIVAATGYSPMTMSIPGRLWLALFLEVMGSPLVGDDSDPGLAIMTPLGLVYIEHKQSKSFDFN